MHDFAIIGSGPAGLAAAAEIQSAGYDVIICEKGVLADGVTRFPRNMRFFSTSDGLELAGFPLIARDDKPTREEYLAYLRRFVLDKKLNVMTGHRVTRIERQTEDAAQGAPYFQIHGVNTWNEPFALESRRVIAAIGTYDVPRVLGVPGEDLPKVSHYFDEVHPYAMKNVAIIGGGNSAAETALLLYRANARVTLICRNQNFESLKYWIAPDITNRMKAGKIPVYFSSCVEEIRQHDIVIRTGGGESLTLANDYVLALTGHEPDTKLLKAMGIETDPATLAPVHNARTLETNVPGLYVAGTITTGNISNSVFIENSRCHGRMILDSISPSA